MKKIFFYICIIALMLNTVLAHAVSLGGAIDFNDDVFTQKNYPNPDTSYSFTSINYSLMADFTYLRINVGYQNIIGKYHTTTNLTDFSKAPSTSADISYLTSYVLAKYPIDIAGKHVLYFWPAVGAEYCYNLTAKVGGKDLPGKSLNDFYTLVSLGLDYYITPDIAITLSPIFGFNRTPKPYDAPGTWSGERGIVLLGFIYKI